MSVLRLGAKGPEVKRLQDLLVQRGYAVAVDGDFGPGTEKVLIAFQTDERAKHGNVAVDGVAGPMTWALLEQRPLQPLEAEDPAMNGLLIGGKVVPVPGHKVIGPHDAAWAHLAPGDCRPRTKDPSGEMLRPIMWVVHKTLADDPEILLPGSGMAGGSRRTAEYWQGDGIYGGAQVVFGDDGEVACLADLLLVEAFHATSSNRYSVGSELREVYGGKFYEAALSACVETILVGCRALGIQLQMQRLGTYSGHPLKRMWSYDGRLDFGLTPGGPDMVGIHGHRSNTEHRSKWDPGEIVFERLAARGVEQFDFDKHEDITAWKDRQSDLVRAGHQLAITGIPLRDTVEALKLEGYSDGIWVQAA